ncbi:MAG: ribosome maturation factor [Chitinophagaceae bacterium]|nr:ribosome maturation factor [Chitinophagaceae bacterium]
MTDVLEKIKLLAEPLLEGTDMFIVRIKNKPTNNIKLYVDAETGLSIGKSADLNRKLYKIIEAEGLFPDGDFSLEVSSPGVDEPLVDVRQYKKNIGRKVLVTQADDTETLGVLKEATEEELVLEVKQPKKKEVKTVNIPLEEIKKTVVQISF